MKGVSLSILEGQAMLPFVVFGSCGVVGAAVFLAMAGMKRHFSEVRAATANPGRIASAAHWQAGRWDADDRHAYVANLGDETAYEVSVTEGEQVLATASRVPPFSAARMATISGPPCYVNFCVHSRRAHRSLVGTTSAPQRETANANPEQASGVTVSIRWRSGRGEWSAQTVHAD